MASPTPVIVSATPAEGTSPTTVMLGSSLSSSSQNVNRSGGSAKRKRTKPNPPIFSTVSNTYVDKSNDFPCPICFELIDEAYMTKCGHSFCHQCITNSLEESNRCPKCNFVIERKDQVFPNFLLNELILKYKQGAILPKKRRSEGGSQCISEIQDIISSENLELSDVNFMLGLLKRRKEHLQADSKAAQLEILKDFLIEVKRHKKEELDQLVEQINCLDEDLKRVDSKISSHNTEHQSLLLNHVVPTTPTGPPPINLSGTGSCFTVDDSPDHGDACHEGFNASRCGIQQTWSTASLPARRKRVHQHFNDLETCYFNMRQSRLTGDSKSDEGLEVFTESLAKFTRFSGFRPLATLSYASDIYNGSSIVSRFGMFRRQNLSIEFDRDCDYFAIAGVTKKIKVFEYNQVVRDVVDIHYPVHEMTCNSKISCITWSQYHKSMLASSDYEGTVTLWDAFTGTHTRLFQEHEKRCWSLDFNMVDPKLLASGSDDAKVKLWATNMEHSVASLEAKANVCCVKFNPESRYHLAFGSADHCVHYYDLRNPKKALGAFKGHRKAVSYAKFVSPTEIVSAPINSNTTLNLSQMRKQGYQPSTTTTKRSTDSQLKLWDVPKQQCLRTYKGHTNEKNFVGLATNGDYIACGSENNSLFVYYKGVSKQLLTYKFDTIRSVLEKEKKEEDANEFVSAVCWKPIKDQYLMWLSVGSEFEVLTSLAGAGTSATKPDSNIVVAANSQGSIKSMFPSENHDGELCYPEMNKNDDLNPNMAQRQVRTCQFNPEEKY